MLSICFCCPYGVIGLNKLWVKKSFLLIISKLQHIKSQSEEDINPFLIQSITQNFSSWTTPLEGWIASAPSTVPNIASHLNAILSQFQAHYYEPTKEEFQKLSSENMRLQLGVSELLKTTTTLEKRKNELNDALKLASKLSDDSKNLLDSANKSKSIIEADAILSGTLRENVESNQAEVKDYVDLIHKTADAVPKFEKERDEILKQCNDLLAEGQIRLDAASKIGMAVSFSDQAREYVWPRRGWLVVFIFSLAAIVGVGLCFIFAEISDLEGLDRLYHFITDLPLSLPFIWLAWFSALRFSQLGRIREDYAFKVATALALDGYRKQAAEVKPELAEKLLDLAITNFGENPLRLLTKESIKDAHPLAGAMDDKNIIEALKILFGKVRK